MNTLKLKDITIVYDENQVNKELCAKKDIKAMLLSLLSAIMILIGIFYIAITLDKVTQNMSTAEEIFFTIGCITLMMILVSFAGFCIQKIVYGKQIKAFNFMDYAFRIKSISAGWFDNNILLKVDMHSDVMLDNSLNRFIRNIKNEHIINDNSNRNNPIHITIDITDNDKTMVSISNV